ncbi:MAG: TetR/AcrR family transcriptional regulator [Bacteroidia bacterium]|nr:TetR/AcrR family transcriptional regulator [Bacteroidia bacterium]
MATSLEQKIIAKAVDFFMKYGVKSVSMDDISSALGISKKTLYNSVDSKQELLRAALMHHLDEQKSFINRARAETNDAVEEMVTNSKFIISILRKHKPSLIYEVQKYYPDIWNLIQEFNNGFIHEFAFENVLRGQNEGHYRLDMDARIIARLYVARISVLIDNELFPIEEFPRAELYEQFITHHMLGMMNPTGIQRFKKIED